MLKTISNTLKRVYRFSRRLWVRSALIAALAVAAAGLSGVVGPFVPEGVKGWVAGEVVQNILDIIATSMLAVTIFSLSVMVTIHRAVSSQWTPRAHRLIVTDRPTMNVLSTFVGAWLFALIAEILRWTAFIGEGEVVVLFGMTMIVVGLIVVMLVRWIAHLEQLGSLAQMGDRLELEARQALERRMDEPCLGGHAFSGGREALPWNADEVRAERTGWVRNVNAGALDALARDGGGDVWLWVPIGRFVHAGDVVAFTTARGADLHERIRDGVEIGRLRSYEFDPRFGLVVMAEVASKALSSGINDAGTAIEIIGRMARVLEAWRDEPEGARDPSHPNLHVPPLRASDLVEDAFAPIARDGSGMAEVQIHLQRTLAAVARRSEPAMSAAARAMAQVAWGRAQDALAPPDLERLDQAVPRAVQRAA